MNQIICLTHRPWSTSPGRTQQLMSRLKDVDILYFSPFGPIKGEKVRPNVTVYGLPRVPGPLPQLQALELYRQGLFIARIAQRRRFRDPLLWTTDPRHVHLLDHIPHQSLVYDCAREWGEFPSPQEEGLARIADLVFAASPALEQRLSPFCDNIALLPNGANYPLFSAVSTSDPRTHTTPTLAFVGAMTSDLDLAPLLYTARQRPDWNFMLLGEEAGSPLLPRLAQLPNVHFTGRLPLTQVADRLSQCQVLLEFTCLSKSYSGVIPSRMYEYLSTGLPVVSMVEADQVEPFPDVVYAAQTHEEFLILCERAMEEIPDFIRDRRRRHGQRAAWPLRAEEVNRILRTAGLI